MGEYDAGEDIVQQYAGEDVDGLRRLLVNWINTAAMHSRNEDYWRERALKAEAGQASARVPPKQKPETVIRSSRMG